MNIKNKPLILIVISAVMIIYFTIAVFLPNNKIHEENTSLKNLVELSIKISSYVHETQKERGLTAEFLSSNDNANFKTALKTQRKSTDEAISKYAKFLNTFVTNEIYIQDQIPIIQNFLNRLNDMRSKIDDKGISVADAISFYAAMNNESLTLIASFPKFSSNSVVSNKLASYTNFLLAKEDAEIERSLLFTVFTQGKFNKTDYRKFIELVKAQDTYMSSFMIIAPNKFKDIYMQKISSNIFQEVQIYRDIAFDKSYTGVFNINPKICFDVISKKIDILKDIENSISFELLDN